MQTVVVTGGTGLIGKSLTKMLTEKGYQVVVFTRKPPKATDGVRYVSWDVPNGKIDEDAVKKADYIIHLAGAGVVDKKWTEKRKQEIIDSRVKSGELLVSTTKKVSGNLKAFIAASAIGWYGADPQIPNPRPFTEDVPADISFLGETCQRWEESLDGLRDSRVRLVKLRTGIVLSNDGGALAEFKKPISMGVAGIIGSGKQIVSWIHIEDLCRQYIYAMENNMVSGVYNAVAPSPVSNKTLTLELARQMKGRFFIPLHVPEFVLKMMMGDRSIEILKSTTVSTDKLHRQGFTFLFPSIESALANLLQ